MLLIKPHKITNNLLFLTTTMEQVTLELRAGIGGIEAGLFVTQLLRMYKKFATKMNWKFETISITKVANCTKEAYCLITGKTVSKWLKNEAGVHRVQRIPNTDTKHRVHTSTVTVAILPPTQNYTTQIDEKTLKIETMRASGAGGQHINKTDSAVRITHLPTGLSANCAQKSQHQNKAKCMKLLQQRVHAHYISENTKARSTQRNAQIGKADRNEKIRTYNFVQDRLTDHKLGVNVNGINKVLDGNLNKIYNF